jgi:TetR/AcrR family transcriptional regulator, cholesterol catabolism regulator
MVADPEILTRSQAARRERVVAAALKLAADGGYDAVQMRDVAQSAGVALGTIYRYFPSKDALLAGVMQRWMADLETRILQRAPRGSTAAERVFDVLRRAVVAMEREPRLAEAVITALTSGDPHSADALRGATEAMHRVVIESFPEDPGRLDDLAAHDLSKVLGHVWFSCLVSWAAGVGDMGWVADELEAACHLVLDHLG